MDETPSEVNLYELIRIAEHEFASGKGEVLDEARLEKEWPALRAALYDAARSWKNPKVALDAPAPSCYPTVQNCIKSMRQCDTVIADSIGRKANPNSQHSNNLWLASRSL